MPKSTRPHLALVFKDFAAWLRTSCVGLNVAGYTTAKALREAGVDVSVFPVRHNVDLVLAIDKYNETHDEPLTHIVISAPWLSEHDLKSLIEHWPNVQFVILSHSNVGFLQADPGGTALLRRYAALSETHSNITVGGNSKRFADWFASAYDKEAVWLPNIYPFTQRAAKPVFESPIKIGAFGAVRPEKNFMTAAAAVVLLQKMLDAPVELHMSAGGEGDQGRTAPAVEQLFSGIPGLTLVRHNWEPWDSFIKVVSAMDLLFQLSYTESFNMVTADGISVGVPSVVSSAIAWAPESWKVDSDNVLDAAQRGLMLLTNKRARDAGSAALAKHNKKAASAWLRWLDTPAALAAPATA